MHALYSLAEPRLLGHVAISRIEKAWLREATLYYCSNTTWYARRGQFPRTRIGIVCNICAEGFALLVFFIQLVALMLIHFCLAIQYYLVAERLSARPLILRRISEIVCMYVCTVFAFFSFAKFSFDKFSCDFIFGRAASSENISSSKIISSEARERRGRVCVNKDSRLHNGSGGLK